MISILMTGANSFTGAHIARALADQGHSVVATLTGPRESYSDALLAERMAYARVHEWFPHCAFGSAAMLELIATRRFDVLVNHGAQIKGYREANFNFAASLETSVQNIAQVFAQFKLRGGRRIIHTGSIFEPDEGTENAGQINSSEAISIYGVSKAMAWQAIRFYAALEKIPLSKIIIPNPVGAFENKDRLFPFFAKQWLSGALPVLRTPNLVRDNIPAEWLAQVYVEEATQTEAMLRIRRPSGFVLSHEAFIHEFLRNLKTQTGKSYSLNIQPQKSTEPDLRKNNEASPELQQAEKVCAFWQSWFASLGLT